MEGFKAIPINKRYLISNGGIIYDTKRNNFKNVHNNGWGYLYASLMSNNKAKLYPVHRLVAITYLPNVNYSQLEVNHFDGNKLNNNISNLEWLTHSQNIQHSYDSLGRIPPKLLKQRIVKQRLYPKYKEPKQYYLISLTKAKAI